MTWADILLQYLLVVPTCLYFPHKSKIDRQQFYHDQTIEHQPPKRRKWLFKITIINLECKYTKM